MTSRRALVVVAVASAALYLLVPPYDWPLLVLIKPIPVFALAVMVRSARRDGYGAALTLGLLISGAGDALLEVPDRFLAGLATFLCAHVAYTVAFLRDERRWRWERAVPFAVWLLAAFLWIRPGLGEMTVPVVVYMLAIGGMMWRAAARWGDHPRAEAAVIGAVLFGLSDTLIAIGQFRASLPGVAVLAIILLYWAGQAGIAASALGDAASYPSRDG